MNNALKKSALLTLALAVVLSCTSLAQAKYFNLGALDVQPVLREGAANQSWFVEYLQPGETFQEKLRISNFTGQKKDLLLYTVDTDKNEGKTFYAKSPSQVSDDIAGWITLPADSLSVGPGESKIISVNMSLPKNAGVGLHTAAIMVREVNAPLSADSTEPELAIEKGVRVYMNVTGPAVTSVETLSASFSPDFKLNLGLKNTGTTDYLSRITLSARSLDNEIVAETYGEKRIKPGTSGTNSIQLTDTPSFGLYQMVAAANGAESTIQYTLILPSWTLLLALAAWIFAASRKTSVRLPSFRDSVVTLAATFNKLEFQKSVAYFMLFAIVATVTAATVNSSGLNAQEQPNVSANSYDITVKWGAFKNVHVPASYKKSWNGEIRAARGHITIKNLLHFENTDTVQITDDGSALRFNLETGPDNDGVEFHLEPKSNEPMTLLYNNLDTGKTTILNIADITSSPYIIPNSLFGTYLKAELAAEHVLGPEQTGETTIISEEEATKQVADIPELENLFIEELPATPEVLADFILNSNYVESVNEELGTTQVATDTILIEALQATPDVLQEIAATPDLNFIFVPTENINFPPQEFSFNETKLSTQEIGTMIFVQNKDTPWNTYLGTSDFTSLSGKGTIPASSLTVVPGNATVLATEDGANIEEGASRTFRGTSDKSLLVNVEPGESEQQVFVLNPTLQIRVPAGTLPGRYRGMLTITSL